MIATKEIVSIVESLSNNNFNKLNNSLSKYIKYYYLKDENITKDNYIEKLYDYFEVIKDYEGDEDISFYIYANTLMSLMKIKSRNKNNSVINKYLEKAETIKKKIKNNNFTIEDIKSLSRIFLCIYEPSKKHGRDFSDKHFSFIIKDINIKKTIDYLSKEKDADYLYSRTAYSIIILIIMYYDMKK